jgi:cell wall assembly regulator SMI1
MWRLFTLSRYDAEVTRIQKAGIGIIVVIAVAVAAGFYVTQRGLRTFFYPVAPPMPPIISESMQDVLGQLEAVLRANAPEVLATLRPGISANKISQLERQYNVQVPDDIKVIFEWHDGAIPMAASNYVDFIPIHHFVPLEDMLAEKADEGAQEAAATAAQRVVYRIVAGQRDNWYCLFDDGSGNGYFFDPTRKPDEGAVFCVFVEDNEFTFFPSAKNLIAGIAKCYEQGAYRVKPGRLPHQLQLDEDFDQSARIWKEFGAGNQE